MDKYENRSSVPEKYKWNLRDVRGIIRSEI